MKVLSHANVRLRNNAAAMAQDHRWITKFGQARSRKIDVQPQYRKPGRTCVNFAFKASR